MDNFVGGFSTYLKQVVQWLCEAKELSQHKCVRGRVTEARSELCSFHKVNSGAAREARPGARGLLTLAAWHAEPENL